MLVVIGLMVGFYIVTRMLEVRTRPSTPLVRGMAIVTILVAIFGMIDLFTRSNLPTILKQ